MDAYTTRAASRAVTSIAAAAIMATSTLGFFSAAAQAQQPSTVGAGGSPACTQVKDHLKGFKCEIGVMKQRGNAADVHRVCTENLTAWATSDPAKKVARVSIVNEIRGDKPFDKIDTCQVLEQAKRQEFRIQGGAALRLNGG